ncbi:cytidyltransferase-like domain-containing protein [Brevinema andersonii]|uniref:Probable nicotinate-nucleotide adenylyltransferase n=1 Tax=Brevinema andersonii TaxID=34097 RepID=A0A1I1D5F0_BREAD|nr:nicotinate-nicotinamide nucleotide adenylyltransferase [Brevinema andersonii]SFB70141.1 cytidyltransferase-like domain-containing protein [Brevinema andersonii]
MKQYAIFGGSFDPFHDGHVAIVCSILKKINPDKLLIVPTGIHPEKKSPLFSGEQRLLMLRAFFGKLTEDDNFFLTQFLTPQNYQTILTSCCKNNKIIICDDEIKCSTTGYTVDFVEKIHKKQKNAIIHLFVGADQAEHFGKWKKANELSKMCILWSITRDNKIPDRNFHWNILPFTQMNISSTEIKQDLKKGKISEKTPKIIQILIEILSSEKNKSFVKKR